MANYKYFKGEVFFITLIAVLFPQTLFSQTLRVDSLINSSLTRETTEKVYIQYDKFTYRPGETIWFKAYLVTDNQPSPISRNFYIDWVNDSGRVIAHQCYPIANGSTHGQFEIPEEYEDKILNIQAYTKWMLNFDPRFLYHKAINISTSLGLSPRYRIISKDTLCFFPEGGNLITGLKNKVAFKALDIFGMPIQVSGYVQSSSGKVVDTFATIHDGMGYFYLKPLPGETYQAIWTKAGGKKYATLLPVAQDSGVCLRISGDDAQRTFSVWRTTNGGEENKRLHLVVSQGQQMVYEADINLDKEANVEGSIDVSSLPSGILRFTLLNKLWLPVAERVCFINNGDYKYSPDLVIDSATFEPGGLNVLSIKSPDSMLANLSLAVTDMRLHRDSQHNIISGLILSSELKGAIYNPAFYFKDTAQTTQRYLDLVMLTNGWRKYNWQQLTTGKFLSPKYPRDSSYLFFSGEIRNPSKSLKKAMTDSTRKHFILIALRPVNDTLSHFLTLPVDSEGRFAKPGLLLFDSLQVSYQFSDKKMNFRSLEMDFIPDKLDQPVNINLRHYTKLSNSLGRLNEMKQMNEDGTAQGGVRLKTVEVIAKAKTRAELLEEKYTTSIFKGVYGYNVDVEDDKKAEISLNILDYLRFKVPGLKVSQTGSAFDHPFLEWTGKRSYPPALGYVPPQIYLNQSPVSPDFIVRVPVSDIAYVKAFVPPFGMDRGGAIAVYTKTDKDYYGRHAPSAIQQQIIVGYSVIKEFYYPPYPKEEDNPSPNAATLYWNPMVLLSAKEPTTKLHFLNTTGSKGYRIILEGFTSNGKLVHIEKTVKN